MPYIREKGYVMPFNIDIYKKEKERFNGKVFGEYWDFEEVSIDLGKRNELLLGSLVGYPPSRIKTYLARTVGTIGEHTDNFPEMIQKTFVMCIRKNLNTTLTLRVGKDKKQIVPWVVYEFNPTVLHCLEASTKHKVFWIIIDVLRG